MTQAQLVILWTVAGLLAAVLFFVGLGKPYLVNAEYEKRKRAALAPLELATKNIPDFWEKATPEILSAVLEPINKQVAEITRVQNTDPNAQSNYITGAVFPIMILGACAFIMAGRQRTLPRQS